MLLIGDFMKNHVIYPLRVYTPKIMLHVTLINWSSEQLLKEEEGRKTVRQDSGVNYTLK